MRACLLRDGTSLVLGARVVHAIAVLQASQVELLKTTHAVISSGTTGQGLVEIKFAVILSFPNPLRRYIMHKYKQMF